MAIKTIKEIAAEINSGTKTIRDVTIRAWVRTNRDSGKIGFISAYDGSTLNGIQVVYKKESTNGFEQAKITRTSAAIEVTGTIQTTNREDSPFEIVADNIVLLKQSCEDFPLQKKQHTMEFLRDIAHLRPRAKTMQAIMMVRNRLAYAIHKFFQEEGFIWAATPILTSNDCEGAGENFCIQEDPNNPFFIPQAKLTVSGQLHGESYAQAFSRIYTFGPTFRAERSHTNRHLAEFWMVEPEIAFMDVKQLMSLIEAFIRTVIKDVYENCQDSINLFAANNPEIKTRLLSVINKEFVRVSYEEGIEILKKAVNDGYPFEDKNIFFGKDLASEHERYICEKVYNGPVFLYNYPKEIKSFYMKQNPDGRTVAGADLLVPGVGEICGGSEREADFDKLMQRVKELNMDASSIQWYLDLRKYGYHSSSGFGLGFERLIMYILDLDNIRDAILFPRYEGNIKF